MGIQLYLWQLDTEDCTCYYGIVEESLRVARKKVIENIESGENVCVGCLSLDSCEWVDMTLEEKKKNIKYKQMHNKEILIDYIKAATPLIHKKGIPFENE